MPGRISELPVLTDPAADDLIEVLDVSDTAETATGKNKQLPLGGFSGGGGGMAWRGVWDPLAAYAVNDVVNYEGSVYVTVDAVVPGLLDPATMIEVVYEADKLALTNGAPVETWTSSGLRTDVTMTCPHPSKPSYLSSRIGGKPAVRLTDTSFSSSGYAAAALGDFVFFAVTTLESPGSYPMLLGTGWTMEFRCGTHTQTLELSWVSSTSSNTTLTLAQPYVLAFHFVQATNTVTIWVNGEPTTTNAPLAGSLTASTLLVLGGRSDNSYTWPGDVSFWSVHSHPFTVEERQMLEGALAWKYGMQSVLPAAHPHKALAPGTAPPDLDTAHWDLVVRGA